MNRWTHPAIHGAFNDGGQNTPPEAPREALGGVQGPAGTEGRGEGPDAADGRTVTFPLRTWMVGPQTASFGPDVWELARERDRARQLAADLEAENARLTEALDRVRALADDAPFVAVHVGGGNLVSRKRMVGAPELRAALDGADS